jgi:spore maturation protein CgeB
MEREFLHGEHLFYYRDRDELPNVIATLIANPHLRSGVAKVGQAKVLASHTYADRVRSILQQFENGSH